jgi:hypothetical protein
VNDAPVPNDGDLLDTSELRPGDEIRVRAVPTDGRDEGAAVASGVVTVGAGAPRIVSEPGGLSADGSFHYRIEAHPDGKGPLRYALREGPEGMSLDRVSGELSWQATADQGGSHRVAVAVEDPRGATTVQEFVLTVQVEDSRAPAAPAR